MEIQRTENKQNNIKKEEQSWRTHTDFTTYYKAIVIKTLSEFLL